MYFLAQPATTIGGEVRVPGDKSVSHRAVMFGAIASGRSEVHGFLPGEDCLATLAAVEAMGVGVTRHDAASLSIDGVGLHGLTAPDHPLDMGNSGTAMRLFAGLLAGQAFDTTLFGDASLSRRPMQRVAEPLRQMGARIETNDGRPPLRIYGGQTLAGIRYEMPVASAQVKSALLLAGLYATGETVIIEPGVTRDHTERMLAAFGQPIRRAGMSVSMSGPGRLRAARIDVPGDLSSAAFMMLAGTIVESGELVIDNVGLNPTRTGILEIFRLMGADFDVELQTANVEGGEPAGRVTVRPAKLRGVRIPPGLVPLAIDEFPVIFVAAALACGETLVSGAAELRHKESDRIAVMAAGLRALGITVAETPDGARIQGGNLTGGYVHSGGDHRVAMAFAVAAARANGPVRVGDTANVATSFPGFIPLCKRIGLRLEHYHDDGRPVG